MKKWVEEKERRKRRREGYHEGSVKGRGKLSSKKLEEGENNGWSGLEIKKEKQLLQLGRRVFLLCCFGHGQSVTLAFVECVMNYTPPLFLLCLCCGGTPAVCTSYNILRCVFSMPVYQPGFFWTDKEKWLFQKSLWWWAQFVFTAKKFIWALWNVGCRWWRDLSRKRCCPPVWLFVWACVTWWPETRIILFIVLLVPQLFV